MKHIGLQLYSVGADMGKDVYATLKRTAELGYTGVEFAGYFGVPAEQMKAWLDELGLKAYSSHTNVFGDFAAETGYLKTVGAQNAVLPGGPSFATEADVLELAEKMNALGKKFREEGIRLGYHNHSHEFTKNGDKGWTLDVLYDNTDPEYVSMQLDVCWAVVGGQDPVEYLKKYQNRVSTVHMKEVLTINPYEGTAIGDGIVDFKAIYELLGDDVVYIVEQEGIKTMETWEGLEKSRKYLASL
ncbi:MAG TPA: sugar phosphate isomerase/epimerase [Clostridiales bacterium]|nr:sugar phosphate isomerase/epimerase [Clostridiales bacterium]